MSLHDDYARQTPFEIAYPDRARFDALVAAVDADAERLGVDGGDPDRFAVLPSVGAFLAEQHGDDVPRVELIQHGVLLFHAVHFAKAGYPLYLLPGGAARELVRAAPTARPEPPAPAGYLQLPQHLFWTGGVEGGPPESLDGFFWVASSSGRLHVLPIVGVRPDRPGFGALSLPDAPMAHAANWLHATVREGEADFTSRLPGADLDELYALEAAGEVLKLLVRFFARVAASEGVREAPRGTSAEGLPRPSALPYVRVPRTP